MRRARTNLFYNSTVKNVPRTIANCHFGYDPIRVPIINFIAAGHEHYTRHYAISFAHGGEHS